MAKSKVNKNYGIVADTITAGAVAIGDGSSAKNITKTERTEQLNAIMEMVKLHLSSDEDAAIKKELASLREELEQGKVKPKKAEGKLAKIVEGLSQSDTIVKKISSIAGASASILALF